jgi:hypothetical protein
MDRDGLKQARSDFFNCRYSIRLVHPDEREDYYRLQCHELTREARANMVDYLRREGFNATLPTGSSFSGHYVLIPATQSELLRDFVARLDKEHQEELMVMGQWVVVTDGWTSQAEISADSILRLDEATLSPEQREGLMAFLNHHGIGATRIVSKNFGTNFVQIADDSVQAFASLRRMLDKHPIHA